MLWIKILITIGVFVFSLCMNIIRKINRKKLKTMQEAAYEILKDEALNHALKQSSEEEEIFRLDKKTMLHMEGIGTNFDYVFNPEKRINIGRNKDNIVSLKDATVSGYHCVIYVKNEEIYMKDLGSSNQTIITRKRKTYILKKSEEQALLSKDIITIGAIKFRITLFQIDKSFFNKK